MHVFKPGDTAILTNTDDTSLWGTPCLILGPIARGSNIYKIHIPQQKGPFIIKQMLGSKLMPVDLTK